VGPARTRDDFERKARTTLEDTLSAIETVRLVAEASSAGNTFGPYSSVSVSEQEDALVDISGDFGSIQPPDATSDAVRAEVAAVVQSAIDHVAAVRISIRRGQLDDAETVAAPLAADAAAARALLEDLE
jgi:hypothetical protein